MVKKCSEFPFLTNGEMLMASIEGMTSRTISWDMHIPKKIKSEQILNMKDNSTVFRHVKSSAILKGERDTIIFNYFLSSSCYTVSEKSLAALILTG